MHCIDMTVILPELLKLLIVALEQAPQPCRMKSPSTWKSYVMEHENMFKHDVIHKRQYFSLQHSFLVVKDIKSISESPFFNYWGVIYIGYSSFSNDNVWTYKLSLWYKFNRFFSYKQENRQANSFKLQLGHHLLLKYVSAGNATKFGNKYIPSVNVILNHELVYTYECVR